MCSGFSDKANRVVLPLASWGLHDEASCVLFSVWPWDGIPQASSVKNLHTYAHKLTWLTQIGTDSWIEKVCGSLISLSVMVMVVGQAQRTDWSAVGLQKNATNNLTFNFKGQYQRQINTVKLTLQFRLSVYIPYHFDSQIVYELLILEFSLYGLLAIKISIRSLYILSTRGTPKMTKLELITFLVTFLVVIKRLLQ